MPELATFGILDSVEEVLVRPRVLQSRRRLILPGDGEPDQIIKLEAASGVKALTADADASGERTPNEVVLK